jgi:hypothetical protein
METVASAITILMVLRVTAANVLRVQDSVFIACVQRCKKMIFYVGKQTLARLLETTSPNLKNLKK